MELFFFSSRRRHTRSDRDWSSDVCSSDLKKLKALPEVERVFGKIGRADTSTDPAPLTMIETTVLLRPKSAWRKGMTKDKLIVEMDRAVETLGYVNAWVQPIRARVMMQTTGIQTPVGVKVTGPDVAVIEELSQ